MDIAEKMKNDLENLKFEMQPDHDRFKLEKDLKSSEKKKNDIHIRNSVFEIETDSLKARFKLGQDLKSLEKEKKHHIDTTKSEDFNGLEKKSSTMERSHSDKEEEERMQRKFEEDEYVCCVCGLKGSKLLDYYSCRNEQLAHRYCALKESKDAAADKTINGERVWRLRS